MMKLSNMNQIVALTVAMSAVWTATNSSAYIIGSTSSNQRPAFVTKPTSSISSTAVLHSTIGSSTDDTSSSSSSSTSPQDLVEEAMKVTKQYGARSMEARLAWEAVEDVGFDNSEATKGNMLDNCIVDLDAAACDEFGQRMRELKKLIASTEPIMSLDERVAEHAGDVDFTTTATRPSSGIVSADGQDIQAARKTLQAAIAEAEQETSIYGIRSTKAQVAWDGVEEIAAAIGHLHAKQQQRP